MTTRIFVNDEVERTTQASIRKTCERIHKKDPNKLRKMGAELAETVRDVVEGKRKRTHDDMVNFAWMEHIEAIIKEEEID
jgi:formate-dependent nitrite reductase cytochrome c552 subunit